MGSGNFENPPCGKCFQKDTLGTSWMYGGYKGMSGLCEGGFRKAPTQYGCVYEPVGPSMDGGKVMQHA